MQKLTPIVLSVWVLVFSCAQQKAASSAVQIRWLTVDQVSASLQQQPRPVLIDLYTDWCSWCKVMDKKTYSNPALVEYVQDKFYPVRINAESRDLIVWGGKKYQYNSSYKVNEFAIYLTNGRLAFPTTIFIPVNGAEPQAIPGYLETRDFEMLAKYFGDGNYKNTPFEQYRNNFKSGW